MKKFLLSLISIFAISVAANAAVITINASDNLWGSDRNSHSGTKDGITITTADGICNGSQYRVYKSSKFTITSTVGNIVSVEFTCTASGTAQYGPGCFGTPSNGTYTYSGTKGTWVGNSTSFEMTASTAQVRFTKLVVTTGEAGGLVAPSISVAEGTYYSAQTVEITNPNPEGQVVYTLDGNDPVATSTVYSEPLVISENTTLKAAVVKDDKMSDITSAVYTFKTPGTVANIAEYLALEDGEVVKFANPVTAVFQKGNYLYAQDETGSMLIYGQVGQTYENGDVVPAGFYGSKTTYNGLVEFSTKVGNGYSTESFAAATEKVEPITPIVATVADITAEQQNKFFVLKGVTFDATAKTITDASGSVAAYTTLSTFPASGEYDIYGFASVYNNVQFLPSEFVSQLKVNSIAEFKELEEGAIATFNNPVTVVDVYATDKYYNYFVADETGGMTIYGKKELMPEYKANDLIPAGFKGSFAMYNDKNPQLENPEGFVAATETGTYEPEEITIEEISEDMSGNIVLIKGVTIADISGKNFTLTDETATMAGYNRMSKELTAADNVAVVGIVNVNKYNGVYTTQIYPVSLDYTNGAEDVEVKDTKVEVIPGSGEILVNGASEVTVYDSSGHRTTSVKGSGDTPTRITIPTGSGFYIVVADGEAEKVIVQ